MIVYNKKRGAEWAEAQKKLEADSLEAARIAYMTGKATDEQIDLVEDQLKRERESGRKTSFFSDISLLSPASATTATNTTTTTTSPQPLSPPPTTPPQAQTQTQSVTETVPWPASPSQQQQQQQQDQAAPKKSSSLWSWLTSNLKREEQGDDAPSQRRLGYESLSEEDDGAGVCESDLARAAEEREAFLRAKAVAAAAAAAAAAAGAAAKGEKGAAAVVVTTTKGDGGEVKEETVAVVEGKKKGWFW